MFLCVFGVACGETDHANPSAGCSTKRDAASDAAPQTDAANQAKQGQGGAPDGGAIATPADPVRTTRSPRQGPATRRPRRAGWTAHRRMAALSRGAWTTCSPEPAAQFR